jgi:hypothetical protein
MALVTEARSFAAVKSKSWVDVRGALQITPASPCDGKAIAWPTAADDDRTMAIRWRERQLVEKPVDTADTADTGETGDTGTTTDDSGKNGEDSPPPIDAGRNDAYVDDETAGGCSCASGGRRGSFVWLLVGLPWLLRRRSAR